MNPFQYTRSFAAAGAIQAVLMRNFSSLSFSSSGILSVSPYNSTTAIGGVIAIRVNGQLNASGTQSIQAYAGFPGGAAGGYQGDGVLQPQSGSPSTAANANGGGGATGASGGGGGRGTSGLAAHIEKPSHSIKFLHSKPEVLMAAFDKACYS